MVWDVSVRDSCKRNIREGYLRDYHQPVVQSWALVSRNRISGRMTENRHVTVMNIATPPCHSGWVLAGFETERHPAVAQRCIPTHVHQSGGGT
jgi:hypothetical protein